MISSVEDFDELVIMMHVSLGLEGVSIGVLQLLGAKRLFPTMSVILVLSFDI